MKLSRGQQQEADEILERETSRVQAVVDTAKSLVSSLSMTCVQLQELVANQVEVVKQRYTQIHANYHADFDEKCGPDCLFTYAEQKFSDAMELIVASITESRGALTAEEIEALALKHGVSYVH